MHCLMVGQLGLLVGSIERGRKLWHPDFTHLQVGADGVGVALIVSWRRAAESNAWSRMVSVLDS